MSRSGRAIGPTSRRHCPAWAESTASRQAGEGARANGRPFHLGNLLAGLLNPCIMFHGTTILCVRRKGKVVIAGDGQVSLEKAIMKNTAKKVRRIGDGSVLAGFAGSTADAFTLFERFEAKLRSEERRVGKECRSRW